MLEPFMAAPAVVATTPKREPAMNAAVIAFDEDR